jgi:hypothetical protein
MLPGLYHKEKANVKKAEEVRIGVEIYERERWTVG